MLDAKILRARFREVLEGDPPLASYLRKIGERVADTGELRGQMKLGTRLPMMITMGLCRLLPNAAIDNRPNGDTILRLDRINATPADDDIWMAALLDVLGFKAVDPGEARQAMKEVAVILDRCRLSYPGLAPIWELQAEDIPNLAYTLKSKTSVDMQRELFQLAQAVDFLLSDHELLGMADFSARFFGDSKVLKTTPSILRRLEEWLLILRDEEISDEARQRIWSEYGVAENLTAIKVTLFGPLVYYKQNERFDWIAQLHARGESATLSLDNLREIDAIELPADTPVITCENETPFGTLVREGIPGLLTYTAGYPNSAVRRILQLLPAGTTIQHWGDSDLDGLRIPAIIHQIHPTLLWRCVLADLQQHKNALLPLAPSRQRQATEYLQNHPNFPYAEELKFTIQNGWLEQERWGWIISK